VIVAGNHRGRAKNVAKRREDDWNLTHKNWEVWWAGLRRQLSFDGLEEPMENRGKEGQRRNEVVLFVVDPWKVRGWVYVETVQRKMCGRVLKECEVTYRRSEESCSEWLLGGAGGGGG
jgi:hypothetical protein